LNNKLLTNLYNALKKWNKIGVLQKYQTRIIGLYYSFKYLTNNLPTPCLSKWLIRFEKQNNNYQQLKKICYSLTTSKLKLSLVAKVQ